MNRSNASAGDGANLLALRSHNTALVLGLLRGAGAEGISRLELAEHTGLTPQAVSKITARLRGEGLAAEAGRRASTGGKPRTVLRLVPEAGHAVGVHLDRDELRAVLVDLDGTVVGERCAPLDLGAGAEAVLAGVVRAAEELVAEVLGPPAARGPGSPGAEGLRTPATEASERSGASARGERALGGRPLGGRGPVKQGPGEQASGKREPGERASEGREPGKRERASERRVSSAGEGAPLGGAALDAAPTLLGLGVALPGPLDHVRGVLHRVTGFPEWDGYPLRDALERRLGVPVVVDKDTNAAALGLAIAGGGADGGWGGGSFAYLHLGTGLGAGLVFGGGVHRGARTGAGEFGHQVVQLDGPPCTCGARGCIEALCLAAVARGDLAEAARVLGTGAANLAGLLDIDQVLLGGRTVAAAPEAFVRGVGAVLDARARREGGHDGAVPVRLASGGPRGVAEGAAQLLLAPLFGHGNGG
ncbi:ROK family protein [Streptomyces sp. KPB2]|uniref:ROK family transcriptional regulator n=2 Tax=unclassified Streptomyces TaxID=2593676 RepID=UPI000F6F251B|nr:ROK family transcriptional regulator [Streptomyces sp. KPB2]AZM77519.1 ROK family protein [Streptomyces sp. KPB2]